MIRTLAQMIHMFDNICESFITSEPEFWLLAGLSDASFETGGSAAYRQVLNSFEIAGLRRGMVERLRSGVNGNLERLIGLGHPNLHPVKGNRGRGTTRPDLSCGAAGTASETLVEVKAVYDMTYPKFYGPGGHGIADDREKLLKIRRGGFDGHLFQVVFFLELPNYCYPAGQSYGRIHRDRRSYQRCCGIDAQYREVRKYLDKPAWRNDAPRVSPLPVPSSKVLKLIEMWMSQTFRAADANWRFNAGEQLKGAAAGYAIWKY